MTYEQLKAQAEAMGFKFDWREWVPDGYIEDEDGYDTKRLITKKDSAWKVTFPPDYPRPFTMIEASAGEEASDEASMIRSLQHAIDEYNNREAIWAENRRISAETERGMEAFRKKFGGKLGERNET